MAQRRTWSETDDQELKLLHASGLSARSIARLTGRTRGAINGRQWILGLSRSGLEVSADELAWRKAKKDLGRDEARLARRKHDRRLKRLSAAAPPAPPSVQARFLNPNDRRYGK